jgi:hypothetical protein
VRLGFLSMGSRVSERHTIYAPRLNRIGRSFVITPSDGHGEDPGDPPTQRGVRMRVELGEAPDSVTHATYTRE